MAGPWEAYQSAAPAVEQGPWSQYGQMQGDATPARSTGEEITRQLGLGTRAVTQGLARTPGLIYDAAAVPFNLGIAGYNKLTGSEVPQIQRGTEYVRAGLDAAGLPTPETRGERMIAAVNEGAASALPSIATGTALASAASPVVQGVGRTLSALPASQVASGAGGDTAAQGAKEMGLGPLAQAGAGIAGALAAPAALSGVSRMIGPETRPQVQELIDKGVTPTYGQIQGPGAKASEDIAARLPGIGPKIQEAQDRTVQQFSTAAVNDALAPIGQRVQPNQTGNRAVAEAHRILSDEYKSILAPVKAMPDAAFLGDVRAAASKAPPEELGAVKQAIDEQFGNIKGALTGPQLQTARRFFESKAYDAENDAVAKAYKGIADSVTQLMTRAAPSAAADLGAADKAWSMFKRVQDAATREAESGTFTPGNLAAASKKLDRFNGYVPYSEGQAVMQPMAQTGLNVLGASPIARGEPALGLGQALQHPVALLGGWARYPLYTDAGQRLTAQLMTQRPEIARAMANALRMNTPMAGVNAMNQR